MANSSAPLTHTGTTRALTGAALQNSNSSAGQLAERSTGLSLRERPQLHFLIAGVQKGGTTALGGHLRRCSPLVCLTFDRSFEDHRLDSMQQLAAFDIVAARERARSCNHSSPLSRYGSEAPPASVLCCDRKLGMLVCVLCRFRTRCSATSSETSSPTGSRPLRRSSRWPLPDASAGGGEWRESWGIPLAALRSSCCCASPCSARTHNM